MCRRHVYSATFVLFVFVQIDEQDVLQAIAPSKDVDGLHPDNVAALCTGRTRAGKAVSWDLKDLDFHVPCTPQVRCGNPC